MRSRAKSEDESTFWTCNLLLWYVSKAESLVKDSMYSALINPVGHAWQHSKADVSLKRGLRSNRTICCDGPRRWSPLEEGKQKVEQVEQVEQKAQQLEQVIEHRMPDTQNLCVVSLSQIGKILHWCELHHRNMTIAVAHRTAP